MHDFARFCTTLQLCIHPIRPEKKKKKKALVWYALVVVPWPPVERKTDRIFAEYVKPTSIVGCRGGSRSTSRGDACCGDGACRPGPETGSDRQRFGTNLLSHCWPFEAQTMGAEVYLSGFLSRSRLWGRLAG